MRRLYGADAASLLSMGEDSAGAVGQGHAEEARSNSSLVDRLESTRTVKSSTSSLFIGLLFVL